MTATRRSLARRSRARRRPSRRDAWLDANRDCGGPASSRSRRQTPPSTNGRGRLYRRPSEDVARAAGRSRVRPFPEIVLPTREAQSRGQHVDVGIFEIDPIRVGAAEGQVLEYDELLGLASWLPERVKRIVPFCGRSGSASPRR